MASPDSRFRSIHPILGPQTFSQVSFASAVGVALVADVHVHPFNMLESKRGAGKRSLAAEHHSALRLVSCVFDTINRREISEGL